MELNEVLLKRRSVRKFTEEKISREHVDMLMHAAMSGPSAGNRKPWFFYVVADEERLTALRTATRFSKIVAPLAVIVCGDLKRAFPAPHAEYWVQDCSAATENILLRAVDLGLGAVWCGVYPQEIGEKNVRTILGIPEDKVPLNVIYVGHPAETPEMRDQYEEACVQYM